MGISDGALSDLIRIIGFGPCHHSLTILAVVVMGLRYGLALYVLLEGLRLLHGHRLLLRHLLRLMRHLERCLMRLMRPLLPLVHRRRRGALLQSRAFDVNVVLAFVLGLCTRTLRIQPLRSSSHSTRTSEIQIYQEFRLIVYISHRPPLCQKFLLLRVESFESLFAKLT